METQTIKLIVISFCLFLYSCTEGNRNSDSKKTSLPITINKDYSVDDIYVGICKKMGLNFIPNIDMNFQIRVWQYKSVFLPFTLLDISVDNSNKINWTLYSIKSKINNYYSFSNAKTLDEELKTISLDDIEPEKLIQNCSDSVFFLKIDSFSIETIPNQEKTLDKSQKEALIDGGCTYLIQITKDKKYNSVAYWAPNYFGQKEENNKRVWNFIEFLESCISKGQK